MYRWFARLMLLIFISFKTINAKKCECHTSLNPLKEADETKSAEASTQKSRNRCCPYNFNGKDCRIVGNRMLCGYDANFGRPYNELGTKDLNNGCRIKGNRVECGYVTGPFTNTRRPQNWNYPFKSSPDSTEQTTKPTHTSRLDFQITTPNPTNVHDNDDTGCKCSNDICRRGKG